jgi:putative holliday junction resolvase
MRYLGIDYGTKKVGLAISDESGTMGFPHSVVPNTAELIEFLSTLIATERIGAVVIGESLDFSGNTNPVAAAAHELGEQLKAHTSVPVSYELEILTTQEARRAIDGSHPQDVSTSARKTASVKGQEAVDASAAALILTSYLSRTHD